MQEAPEPDSVAAVPKQGWPLPPPFPAPAGPPRPKPKTAAGRPPVMPPTAPPASRSPPGAAAATTTPAATAEVAVAEHREQVFKALRRHGAHVLQAGSAGAGAGGSPAIRPEAIAATGIPKPGEGSVSPDATTLAVAVDVAAASTAHGLVRQLAARRPPQLTIVLLLRYAELDFSAQHSSLVTATKAFNQLKADGVFWEPRTCEGLDHVVEMWLTCAAERAKEREQERADEAQRQDAPRRQAEQFWSEVHTVFNNIPQVSLRIGEPEVGGRIGRHHDIIKLLGTGAHARVFLVRNIPSAELKALKALAKEKLATYNQVQAVAKEISNLKRLSHPNIISFLGAAHTPKNICLLLDYAGSKSLFQAQKDVGDEGILQPGWVQPFFQQVASAIAHCHSRGLAHRDIKQENVVVGLDGITAKLVDFGAGEELWAPLELWGTVPFIAPEVMANEQVEYSAAQADVWSLGMLLLEMLCGIGFLPDLLHWSMPTSPRPELAEDLRGLLADWPGLTQAIDARQALRPGTLALLRNMLGPSGGQRWSASAVAGYTSYGDS